MDSWKSPFSLSSGTNLSLLPEVYALDIVSKVMVRGWESIRLPNLPLSLSHSLTHAVQPLEIWWFKFHMRCTFIMCVNGRLTDKLI